VASEIAAAREAATRLGLTCLINPSCASRAGAAGGDPQTAMAGVRAAADSPAAASRCLSRSRSWAPGTHYG
jgi:hypothetical protein